MHKVIFLDRDGVINVDHGYVHEVEKFEFANGAIEGMKKLQAAGYKLAIVTNQSGIAAGYYGIAEMEKLHEYMLKEIAKSGVIISVLAYCPHGREGNCECRKPKLGMIKKIEVALGEIDYANSWMIGDKEIDMQMGKAAGTRTVLVRSKYWKKEDLVAHPDMVVDSLREAAELIVTSNQ